MPGAGTKTDTTTNSPPPARVLDLTRLISRAGRVATGVDRVELAYLNQLLALPEQCFALVRTRLGYVVLDRVGMSEIHDRVEGRVAWGQPDGWSFLARTYSPERRRAEADLRRICIGRSHRRGLKKLLLGLVPQGATYLNVGHSNFSNAVVSAFRDGLKARVSVLVHDTIPLDFPHYQRPETVGKFRGFLRRVSEQADLVICNSEDTQRNVRRVMQDWGRVPETIVSHLGTIPVPANQGELPGELDVQTPYFLIVGTIEPRKNHGFLLDIWQEMAASMPINQVPQLIICGARGWNNEVVFQRLDETALRGAKVVEIAGLSDAAVSALMNAAAGVLFPSFAEGFGLPAVEAASAGIPLICNDLSVFREILGDIPIYASVSDSYLWKTIITGLAQDKETGRDAGGGQQPPIEFPTWEKHFNVVLKVT